MTTIFSDGNFLIADKRASFEIQSYDANAPGLKLNSSFTKDDDSKIYIPKSKKLICWNVKENVRREVAAIAFAGNTKLAENAIRLAEEGVDLYTVFRVARLFSAKELSGSFIALCTDGTTVRQVLDAPGNVRVYKGKNGSIVGTGSGYHSAAPAVTLMKANSISLMDAFVYAVHCDKSSNSRFDVFSLKENRLIKDLRISRTALTRAIKNMERCIDLSIYLER